MSPKDKEILDRIYNKHYGKGSKAQKEKENVKKAIAGQKEKEHPIDKVNAKLAEAGIGITFSKPKTRGTGPSRNDLMLKAKDKGIKNFRILNKEELEFVLCEGQSAENIAECVRLAIERWKSGFGKGKKQTSDEVEK
jgi:hypothetical protein